MSSVMFGAQVALFVLGVFPVLPGIAYLLVGNLGLDKDDHEFLSTFLWIAFVIPWIAGWLHYVANS